MVDKIQSVTNSANNHFLTTQVDSEIQKALGLIDAAAEQGSKVTVKEMKELLIAYILANMAGNKTEVKDIQAQMTKVTQTYENSIQEANAMTAKLKAMEGNPGVHLSQDLTYLQSVIAALEQDTASGDMSNLQNLNAVVLDGCS